MKRKWIVLLGFLALLFVLAVVVHAAAPTNDTTQPTIVTLEQTRPVANVLAVAAGISALACAGLVLIGLARLQRQHQIAWQAAVRRVNWIIVAVSAAVIIVLLGIDLVNKTTDKALTAVEMVIPIAMAIQAAAPFAPRDDAAIEVMLAAARPYYWIPIERLLIAFAMQAVVALAGIGASLIIAQNTDLGLAMLRWLPTTIFLSGLAIFLTARSQEVMLGGVFTILVWFITLLAGKSLLPAFSAFLPSPLNVIQPYLWPFHIYLQPDDLTFADYLLNRIILTGAGCALIGLAVNQLRNTERVLLGAK